MPLAKNVMRAGISAGAARAINGNEVNSAVTATGTTVSDAAAVKADVNIITAGASATGVQLSSGTPGDSQVVYNSTSTDKVVYPPTGVAINQLAANSGFVLAPRTACSVLLVKSTAAVGFISA